MGLFKIKSLLFKGSLSSNLFQLLLDLFSLFLRSAFLQGLGSVVNKILSFLQAQTGYFTNNLDNLNLLRTNLGQLNVEIGLLFNLLFSATC